MKARLFTPLTILLTLALLLPSGTQPVTAQTLRLDVAAQSNGAGWVEVKTAQEAPDGVTQMVYDSNRQRTVALGHNSGDGHVEMWEYAGSNWIKKSDGAGFRDSASSNNMVYDVAHKHIVLFGTIDTSDPDYHNWKTLNDTWEYDGSTWQKKATSSAPTPRQGYSMSYDSNRQRVVLFGGSIPQPDGTQTLLNDTWEYDGVNWVQHPTSASPPPRSSSAMTYDSARSRIVLFGGGDFANPLQDTWEYDGVNWMQKITQASPLARCATSLAFDSGRARTVLFGGGCYNPTLNDTWEYDGVNWTQFTSGTHPPDRESAGFVYDSKRNRMVLSGGDFLFQGNGPFSAYSRTASPLFGGGGDRNDTWEYVGLATGPKLVITKVEFDPNPPTAFQRARVRLTIENQGASPLANVFWNYTGHLTLRDVSSPHQETVVQERAFANGPFATGQNATLNLDPQSLTPGQPQRWLLTINTYFWQAINTGRLDISLQPGGGLPPLTASQSIVIKPVPPEAQCGVWAAQTIAGVSGGQGSEIFDKLGLAGELANCHDRLCTVRALVDAIIIQPIFGTLQTIISLVTTKGQNEMYQHVKDCGPPAIWVSDMVKDAISKGVPLAFAGIHSPANVLITNAAGQRVGLLDNGTLVQEIPGSQVAIVGTEKYVLYPVSGPTTARLKGTGTGTMTVEMITGDGSDSGRDVTYNAVPVTPKLVAQVASTDAQATLQVDNNGDGKADQTRRPDTLAVVPPATHTFAETGQTVSGGFWAMWQGGRNYQDSLYINGLPITDKHPEVNPTDGKTYQVQWFERARFEDHPENQPPFNVELGLLGVSSVQGRQNEEPFKSVPNPGGGLQWFQQTGHTLGDNSEGGQAIATFWTSLGGLQQFGYPLSQPFMEVSKDNGHTYLVQYFERQRFEYHPENKGTPYEVLLGRLGAEQVGKK